MSSVETRAYSAIMATWLTGIGAVIGSLGFVLSLAVVWWNWHLHFKSLYLVVTPTRRGGTVDTKHLVTFRIALINPASINRTVKDLEYGGSTDEVSVEQASPTKIDIESGLVTFDFGDRSLKTLITSMFDLPWDVPAHSSSWYYSALVIDLPVGTTKFRLLVRALGADDRAMVQETINVDLESIPIAST